MSSMFDVADTDENMGKEHTPKEVVFCGQFLGHTFNRCMTVIG